MVDLTESSKKIIISNMILSNTYGIKYILYKIKGKQK